MKIPELASKKQCTGCGACAATCTVGAIVMSRQGDGHFYPSVNADICIGCLQCEKVCPVQSKFEYGTNAMTSTPLKAWNNNADQRMKSSSGGVFSAVAYRFIENGDFVSGAVIDGLKINHIVSCNADDIIRMQGSKYLQSETTNAFKKILEILPSHKVLFSGTGCQVGGLLCLVRKKNPELLSNLFCVDIVCDGVPSYRLLEKTIESLHCNDVSIVSFRNKSKGWNKTPKELILSVDGVEKNLGEANLMICGFNKSLTSRYSCYDCQFAYTDRLSDITIADFWGVENESDENLYNGVSLAIVHSTKGQQLLDDANIQTSLVEWSEATKVNFRIYQGKKYGFDNTWLRRNLGFLFDRLPYSDLNRFYGAALKSRFDLVGRAVHRWYHRKAKKMKKSINKNKLV